MSQPEGNHHPLLTVFSIHLHTVLCPFQSSGSPVPWISFSLLDFWLEKPSVGFSPINPDLDPCRPHCSAPFCNYFVSRGLEVCIGRLL